MFKRHKIDWDRVAAMIARGATNPEIASQFGMTARGLMKACQRLHGCTPGELSRAAKSKAEVKRVKAATADGGVDWQAAESYIRLGADDQTIADALSVGSVIELDAACLEAHGKSWKLWSAKPRAVLKLLVLKYQQDALKSGSVRLAEYMGQVHCAQDPEATPYREVKEIKLVVIDKRKRGVKVDQQ